VWDTACRQILTEFGDVPAYSVPLSDCSGFISVGQSSLSVAAPFHITYVRPTDDGGVDKIQVISLNYTVSRKKFPPRHCTIQISS